MSLVIGLVLLAAVVFQWLTQTIYFRLAWFWRLSFHRDEWPAFYWIVMGLEFGLAVLFIVMFFF